MATPGTIFSGLGHIGLIGWLVAGWGFNAEPLRIETMDISVISGEEFDHVPSFAWANQTVEDRVVADQEAAVARSGPRTTQIVTSLNTLWTPPIFAVLLATA